MKMASLVEEIRAAGPSTPVDLTAVFSFLVISNVSRASFGNKQRNANEFLSAVKAGVTLASGFKIPDLFPTWREVLDAVTGMRRTLEEVHRIVDSTLEEVIEERRGAREEKAKCGMVIVEENLVDVLIRLHEQVIITRSIPKP
ncbi:hypothetical protein E2562_019796 [Oryza meyeriana var. granulata]|uniref:Uncharacterized protein n=1 Tax=Oryza meyeriana var. granulata TaxID=110450 RepID=A0A6G1DK41_9ORYZ|nr:hypothetical protein E2562_019796 [Oryza meyeriana var. granulata]